VYKLLLRLAGQGPAQADELFPGYLACLESAAPEIRAAAVKNASDLCHLSQGTGERTFVTDALARARRDLVATAVLHGPDSFVGAAADSGRDDQNIVGSLSCLANSVIIMVQS
jgi:hypothetical protein